MLEDAGVRHENVEARIDERMITEAAHAQKMPLIDIATLLAETKAARIAARNPDAVIIGADQLLVFDNETYAKPENLDEARQRLQLLSGKTHELVTAAVIMIGERRLWHQVSSPKVTLRQFDETFIEAYLHALGNAAFQTPGVYAIEGLGAQLVRSIEGCHYTVLGFPLLECLEYLREIGLEAS